LSKVSLLFNTSLPELKLLWFACGFMCNWVFYTFEWLGILL
jgi:hypothetical protein